MLFGMAGALGAFGPNRPYLAALASLAAGWTFWCHRWPTGVPLRLRPSESPQGPDERAVTIEIRHEGTLLGWDVGILWFEKGGIGFVGRTVSFVLPRASMQAQPILHDYQAVFRSPQMTAKVFQTTVGITPLGEEMKSQMTLARIDALPGNESLETILPPTTMHPDLLQRDLAVKKRKPILVLCAIFALAGPNLARLLDSTPNGLPKLVYSVVSLLTLILIILSSVLPSNSEKRLPKH